MSDPKHSFHSGKVGTALAVRVIPRSARNEIAEVLSDGVVKVRLKSSADSDKLNTTLVSFLSSILGVAVSNIEVISGVASHSKLVSVLDMDSGTLQEKIIQNIV